MNGKVLAIGVLLLTIISCIAVYFIFQLTLNKEESGLEQTTSAIEYVETSYIV